MTTVYNKCYYIVATIDDTSYFIEGDFDQEYIDQIINNFDIDDFMSEEPEEEFAKQTDSGYYAVYRQSMLSTQEMLDIGVAKQDGDEISIDYDNATDEMRKLYEVRKQQIEQEVFAEFGESSLVCLKKF